MQQPKLGKQTFLTDNNERIFSYEKFLKNVYASPSEIDDKPLYTGRYLVINLDSESGNSKMKNIFENNASFTVASTDDFINTARTIENLAGADVLVYEGMGIALVSGNNEQIAMMEASTDGNQIIVPERIVYVPDDMPMAINMPATWGITKTNVVNSIYSGKGVKVAILDTGFDLSHPDYIGRTIVSQSFVPNELVDDLHGHGTHCVGVACGNTDKNSVRYGVAKDAEIYVGKVLGNQGSGAQSWILDGIEWAVKNGCRVVSMSLGSKVFPGLGYDQAYEKAAKYANKNGAVIIAAAGNDSRRSQGIYWPVSSPADCPSVMAVGAVDVNMNLANFTNRAIPPGGNVDIVGPGVDVYSSWPSPAQYRSISGTSMATPFVAGIAALFCEKYPHASALQIANYVKASVNTLTLPTVDVGAGFVLAP